MKFSFYSFLRYIVPEAFKIKFGFIPFAIIGYFSKILGIKVLNRDSKILIDHKSLNLSMRGTIITGYYENEERILINKYLEKDLPVIELGAGIGITTMQIRRKTNKSIITLEPDKISLDALKANIKLNDLNYDLKIINKGIGYEEKNVLFKSYDMFLDNHIQDKNTYSKKRWKLRGEYLLETIKLRQLIVEYNLKKYQLVCDIEGKELDIIKSGDIDPNFCKLIIIELHSAINKNKLFKPNDQINLIKDLGFKIIYKSFNQLVFEPIAK